MSNTLLQGLQGIVKQLYKLSVAVLLCLTVHVTALSVQCTAQYWTLHSAKNSAEKKCHGLEFAADGI